MSFSLSALFDELYPAEFRGVPFHLPDAREETGRRVQRTFFPGRDDTRHDDFGALDGAITVAGLILGDDYIRRARRLREAFRTPGPGLLVHPWLGEVEVVLLDTAEISFVERELRLARFHATFEPWRERRPAPPDTLGLLLARLDALREGARRYLGEVLAPVRLAVAVVGAAGAFAGGAAALIRRALGASRGAGALRTALLAPLEGLLTLGTLDPRRDYARHVADRLAAPSLAVWLAALPAPPPAVAPFTPAAPAPTADAAGAVRLLLGVAAGLGPEPLALATRALVLADAAALGAQVPFGSRDEAMGMLDALDAALAGLGTDLARAAAADPFGAGQLHGLVAEVRRELARDLSERAGRLPATAALLLPRDAPTWLVAQHLAGDRPAAVAAQHRQIVARNRLRDPGLCPAGPIEILA